VIIRSLAFHILFYFPWAATIAEVTRTLKCTQHHLLHIPFKCEVTRQVMARFVVSQHDAHKNVARVPLDGGSRSWTVHHLPATTNYLCVPRMRIAHATAYQKLYRGLPTWSSPAQAACEVQGMQQGQANRLSDHGCTPVR
jgi:hypothetical protein